MNIPLLTLDTNVLHEYFKKRKKCKYVEQLLDLAEQHEIELAVTARIHEDIPRNPLAERLNELSALNIQETGTVMRIDMGIIDRDIIGDDVFGNFESMGNKLAKQRVPGKAPPDYRDWDHLHGHYLLRRDIFLTWDEPILCLYKELRDQFGVIVMKPEEYLNERWIVDIFQREVIQQSKFAIIASEDLGKSIDGLQQATKERSYLQMSSKYMDRIWYSIQSLLTAAGIISFLFWPKTPKYFRRGYALRTKFGVPDDSPLKTRNIRNSFEHIDERIEDWADQASKSGTRPFVDYNVGLLNMFGNIHYTQLMRHFNPDDYSIIFRGEVYHIKSVIEAIEAILKKSSED